MNKLEIILNEANGEPVSLKSMSPEALESFLSVMSSLKAIAVAIANNNELSFSITEGSAKAVLEAPSVPMDSIYKELDIAMKGQSEDKEVTTNLRNIQDQIKRQNFNYGFLYKRVNQPTIDIFPTLYNSNRISLKRKKNEYEFKLIVKSGFLNQIGGNSPNYHFDFGNGEKITISCTVDDAMTINQCLYKNVQALLLCKKWYDINKRDDYFHKIIIEDEFSDKVKLFFTDYNKENDLVKKLTFMHDFIDDMFNEKLGHKMLYYLLIAFNDKNLHLSELKTLLVISKAFKNNEIITKAREALVKTYTEKKNKSII